MNDDNDRALCTATAGLLRASDALAFGALPFPSSLVWCWL